MHAAQVVAAAVLADGDVLGAAGGEGPRPVVAGPGPRPAERDVGSGTVRGVTVSGTVVWKARPSSTRPNGSVTRTVIGPISKRPRTSERTW